MLHVNSVVEMVARLGEETEESSGWSSSGGWVDDTSVTAPRDEKAWGQLGPAGPPRLEEGCVRSRDRALGANVLSIRELTTAFPRTETVTGSQKSLASGTYEGKKVIITFLCSNSSRGFATGASKPKF